MVICKAGYDDERFEFHAELKGFVVFSLDDLFGASCASPESPTAIEARPFEIAGHDVALHERKKVRGAIRTRAIRTWPLKALTASTEIAGRASDTLISPITRG